MATVLIIHIIGIMVIIALMFGAYIMGKRRGLAQAHAQESLLEEKLQTAINTHQAQMLELHSQNSALTAQNAELNNRLSDIKEQLSLVQQNEQLRLTKDSNEQKHKLLVNESVIKAFEPVKAKLDDLQHKVMFMEEARKRDLGALDEQLKGLDSQQRRLDSVTSSLSSALCNSSVRGAWGEVQLKNIVEAAGLTEHIDFDTQVKLSTSDDKSFRPDMIIHLPGNKTIPIDSKAPYNNYRRACEIDDSADEEALRRRTELLKAHAADLRGHINALSKKSYWELFETNPDFVIAFIPNEALLQAALAVDEDLLTYAFSKKVALTSPITLWAVLKSVACAWHQQELSDNARELFNLSQELCERLATLGDKVSAVGKNLSSAVKNYNSMVGTLETRVLASARKMKQLDGAKLTVQELDSEKTNVRELSASEFLSTSASEDAQQ